MFESPISDNKENKYLPPGTPLAEKNMYFLISLINMENIPGTPLTKK